MKSCEGEGFVSVGADVLFALFGPSVDEALLAWCAPRSFWKF